MVPEADSDDGVLMVFIGAIAREAQRFGYDILLVTAQEGAQGIRRVVRTGVCEALILMELGRHDERVATVIESGLPFVTIGKPDELPQGSAVDLDFEMLGRMVRSEEHTSELQSRGHLVCRLLLEKKKSNKTT